MQLPTRLLALLCAVPTFAPAAAAQMVLYTYEGNSPVDQFGYSVSGAGDVNADGFDDFVVGVSREDNTAPNSGTVIVYSGVDGSILYSWDGDAFADRLGDSVSGAGDVNGDGFDDVIAGIPDANSNGNDAGSARVFSGIDGSILYTFDGDSAEDILGNSVSGAGDVNADGFDDVIVGALEDDDNGTDCGSARVYSGVDGSVLYTFYGDSAGDVFGTAVSGAGDVNADGFADLAVGAPCDDSIFPNSGSARVFSGADGSVLYTFEGLGDTHRFGTSIAGAGDVDGDGFDDVIVGAPIGGTPTFRPGSATVFSGANGSILYTFLGDDNMDNLGRSVDGAGDVNGDGFHDLIVGVAEDDVNGAESGSVRIFPGRDGSLIYTHDGDAAEDYMGWSVAGAGDVNGDGLADLIVGAPLADPNGIYSGRVRVLSGAFTLGSPTCSPAVPNSSGVPAFIAAYGSDTIADNFFVLSANDLPAGQFGYFLAGRTPGLFMPPGSQGNLCLSGNIGRFNAPDRIIRGPVASIEVDLGSIPVNPPAAVAPGDAWYFQCWFRDNDPGPTSNFTDAVIVFFP